MISKSIKESFDNFFLFNLDSNLDFLLVHEVDFWRDFYINRVDEYKVFNSFMTSDASLALLTGFVGSGKSTFVKRVLSQTPDQHGISLDFRLYESDLNKCGNDIGLVTGAIYNCVHAAVRTMTLNQLREELTIAQGGFTNIDSFPPHYSASFRPTEDEYDYFLSAECSTKALCLMFALIVSKLMWMEEVSNFVMKYLLKKGGIPPSKLNNVTEIASFLYVNNDLLKKFNRLSKWNILIHLQQMMISNHGKFLLIFDNVDVLKSGTVKSCLIDTQIDMVNEINLRYTDTVYQAAYSDSMKAILCVRDENIRRINLEGAGTMRVVQIKLHETAKDLNVDSVFSITRTPDFFYRVTVARLEVIEKISNNENESEYLLMAKFIRNFLLDENTESFRSDQLTIGLHTLANHSLRALLHLVTDLSYRILSHAALPLVSNSKIFQDRLYVESLIVDFLFEESEISSTMNKILTSTLRETENSDYLCIYRHVLGFLYNSRNRTAQFKEIYDSILNLFESIKDTSTEVSEIDGDSGRSEGTFVETDLLTGEKEVKYLDPNKPNWTSFGVDLDLYKSVRRAVFHLSNTGSRENEIVTIYSRRPVLRAKDIKNRSVVKLNHKGRSLIERILINIDFLGHRLNSRKDTHPLLFELLPGRALRFCKKQYKYVNDMHVLHHVRKSRANFGYSSPSYYRVFCATSGPYVQRLASKFANEIRRYIAEALLGEDSSLLLINSQRMDLLSNFALSKDARNSIINTKNPLTSAELDELLEHVDSESLIELLGLSRSFDRIAGNIN